MITLIDTQQSNISSVRNMLKRIGVPAVIAQSPDELAGAEKIILPGVGHFATVMRWLNESGYRTALDAAVLARKTPILGICLGMQLMAKYSEEGNAEGLGWLNAEVCEFRGVAPLPVPHMGWSEVNFRQDTVFASGYAEPPRFYFVHSYYVRCNDPADRMGVAQYGLDFTAAFQRGNIVGVQFHPEKSHAFGMAFLKHFAEEFYGQ